jgi:hypothetical protein
MRRAACGLAVAAVVSAALAPATASAAPSASGSGIGHRAVAQVKPVISAAVLDQMRIMGDPAADRVVADLTAQGQLPAVNALLRRWVYNDQPLPSGLPSELVRFIDRARQLPPWADQARIAKAAEFGDANKPALSLAYSMGVSTAVFTYPILASVFDPSTDVALVFSKRLIGSLKLISGVYDPGAFGPKGQIIPDLVKVRLMHAAVRVHLDDPSWDTATWGIPISQESMLLETLVDGLFPVAVMQHYGVKVPADVAGDFLHTWRVEGALLGVPADVMPADPATAADLLYQFDARDQGASQQGQYLLNSYVAQVSRYLSGPGSIDLTPIIVSAIRCTIGNRLAGMLDIPATLWDDQVCPALQNLRKTEADKVAGPLGWFVQVIKRMLGEDVQMVVVKGEPAYLDIPTWQPGTPGY